MWYVLFPRGAQEQAELAKHRAERPKILQQLADLKRGLSSVTDERMSRPLFNLAMAQRGLVETCLDGF